MLVDKSLSFKLLLVVFDKDILENILKKPIITLQDSVLSTKVQRKPNIQSEFKAGMSEPCDRLTKKKNPFII